ncbi:MAG: phosphoribosylformylglycinamidine synthase subunit PurL, partial [Candidatus Methanomethylicota archaeon]
IHGLAYHQLYKLVDCRYLGILPLDKYVKSVKPGDLIVLAGGRTGRDGIHGVTFASSELDEKSEKVSRSAVQIPNPIEEEKLARAVIRIRNEKLGSAITDLGGGGISCAVNETAHRFGCGAVVELSKVPLKDPDLCPWEIWLSESQERMLLAVPERNLGYVLDIFKEEDIEATPIGRFVEGHDTKVYYKGFLVADLKLDFIFNPPKAIRYAEYVEREEVMEQVSFPEHVDDVLLRLLSSPNITSKEAVIRTYDHEVKGLTALKPLHGLKGAPNDAAVLKPLPNSWKGLAIACGIKPSYGRISAYWMAASCIDEAIRNSVAVGGRRWALLDNFTWGNPEKPDRMGALLKAVEACYEVAKGFEAPFISGKDSLYNESPLGPVTPTLLITSVSIVPDIRKIVSVNLKQAGNPLYVLGVTKRELGGSEYLRILKASGGRAPKVNVKEAKRLYDHLITAIDLGFVAACHDVSDGGLGIALAEMCLASDYGAKVHLTKVLREDDVDRDDILLFSETNSRLVVEVKKDKAFEFEKLMEGVAFSKVGEVSDEARLTIYGLNGDVLTKLDVDSLWDAWSSGLKL